MVTPSFSASGRSSFRDFVEFSQTVLYGTIGREGSHVTCADPGMTRIVSAPIHAAICRYFFVKSIAFARSASSAAPSDIAP